MGHRPRSLLFASAVSACGWGLVCGCASSQTHRQPSSEPAKANETNADLISPWPRRAMFALEARKHLDELMELQRRTTGPSFTPRQIESIDGVEGEDGGLRLGEDILFDEGSTRLKSEASAVLDSVLAMLEREHPGESIVIEGHKDKQYRRKGRFGPGMDLGYSRVHSVFLYFVENGFPESCIQVVSYSDSEPIDAATAETEAGRRANRRVVIRLAGPGV